MKHYVSSTGNGKIQQFGKTFDKIYIFDELKISFLAAKSFGAYC